MISCVLPVILSKFAYCDIVVVANNVRLVLRNL